MIDYDKLYKKISRDNKKFNLFWKKHKNLFRKHGNGIGLNRGLLLERHRLGFDWWIAIVMYPAKQEVWKAHIDTIFEKGIKHVFETDKKMEHQLILPKKFWEIKGT